MSERDQSGLGGPLPYPGHIPPPPPTVPAKRTMGCLPKLGIGLAILAGLIVVGAIVGGGGDGSGGDGRTETAAGRAGETTGGQGIETDSNNEENPPPADINDDLACTSEQFTGAKASGTLTNHSSELSGYVISVGFLDAAGTRVAEATAFVNSVQSGQTATWEAIAFDEVPFETCEVVSVERMAQ